MSVCEPSLRLLLQKVQTRFVIMSSNDKYNWDINVFFAEMLAENERLKSANEILRNENARLKKSKAKE